ncbi:MAG TPA: ribonuclease P protein component, partial [Clostridiales bacterium]|nr:ribonuclease P protein component [Clostridiales bacterium]
IGVTAAKKIGSAVERNRARRVIKEAYRSICPRIDGGWDLVFVAREGTGKKKSPEIAAVMQAQLKKAGVLA